MQIEYFESFFNQNLVKEFIVSFQKQIKWEYIQIRSKRKARERPFLLDNTGIRYHQVNFRIKLT